MTTATRRRIKRAYARWWWGGWFIDVIDVIDVIDGIDVIDVMDIGRH